MNKRPVIKDNTPEEEADILRQIVEEPTLSETPMSARVIKRGRPVGRTKEQVTVRIDKDVIEQLKSPDSKGWQTRLNDTLRAGLKL